MKFSDLKVGDIVTRMLPGEIPVNLKVTQIENGVIHCGPWTFNQDNGAEIDNVLGWDGVTLTGSYLIPPKSQIDKVIVETESGSVYCLDRAKMAWSCQRKDSFKGPNPLRTKMGQLLVWPAIEIGQPMRIIGPPIDPTMDGRAISTSRVIKITQFDKK